MNSFVSTHKDIQWARSKLLEQLRREIRDQRVIQAMERVPRELFVPRACRHLAYGDIPLLIEEGQTISQPFIVALMTEALELKGDEKVLEIGTGSGYQTAILAELARWVVSVERHPKLAQSARELLNQLGYQNVEIHIAEKTLGWPLGAPYDAIIVTAGAPQVPPELLELLVVSGRMVIPVGSRYNQDLLRILKLETKITTVNLGPCRFVPLIGEGAWQEEPCV
ncbi:MAG: protein-L-isoaspartate(D-aspartate) O-methyltransferase [Chloroflexi bacterium]|nr:protein-L-isoaspartate(D-aspartate) O-methyltransferase [Chloroflexota bacterium]